MGAPKITKNFFFHLSFFGQIFDLAFYNWRMSVHGIRSGAYLVPEDPEGLGSFDEPESVLALICM